MNFYKILNEKETHNDLAYKTGLNKDPILFQFKDKKREEREK